MNQEEKEKRKIKLFGRNLIQYSLFFLCVILLLFYLLSQININLFSNNTERIGRFYDQNSNLYFVNFELGNAITSNSISVYKFNKTNKTEAHLTSIYVGEKIYSNLWRAGYINDSTCFLFLYNKNPNDLDTLFFVIEKNDYTLDHHSNYQSYILKHN